MPDIGWTATTGALALIAVLGGLVLTLRGVRAAGLAQTPGRRLVVVEAVALDTRRRVVLLRCDGRGLLLLTGGAQDLVLGWLPHERTMDPPA
ncbi:flagellar biosynthetic protein FliO [Falsiroseomonas oryziterrae]|uniref:flagellar biosynthetic protein FliO n=1 Tax=Falsiroseomonas oryziterrae TaxID=2911368 RepID=UPI001F020658|nr:flagellar biosynthetic protein FliO [Roseomonas sp. NPKOSM-4]